MSIILQLRGLSTAVSAPPASHGTPPHHHAQHYPVLLIIKHASFQFGGSKVRAPRELVICGRSIRSSLLMGTENHEAIALNGVRDMWDVEDLW